MVSLQSMCAHFPMINRLPSRECRRTVAAAISTNRVGQIRKYTPYMTVYLAISLPEIPYVHHIYMVLANPKYLQTGLSKEGSSSTCLLSQKAAGIEEQLIKAFNSLITNVHTHTQTHTQETASAWCTAPTPTASPAGSRWTSTAQSLT
jgi:hypothetical protein